MSKANDGEDGIGYESMILTRKLVEDWGVNKFIPIIRQSLSEEKTPEFLKERVPIDFTDDDQFDEKFAELLHERLLVPSLQRPSVPYIETLHVKNYRALRDVELKQLKPLTVFLGANGSGKSTLFDVFAFLTECFMVGLDSACKKRGGLKELRTRGCEGPIEFELKYREKPKTPIITYHLSVNESAEGPYPERLDKILSILSERVPRLEKIDAKLMDNRLLLQIKDTPFEQPILAKFASDGTLKLLSYLTLFHDRQPPQLIGIEEPENYLHPRLLTGLVGDCLKASASSQLIITTHSPQFVNELTAEEVWVLYWNEQGWTVCKRASDMLGINHLMEAGAKLGQLWREGFFEFGDPLTNSGGPKRGKHAH